MEFEQITKRLEWLDEQHQKNRTALNDLTERMGTLDAAVSALTKQIRTLSKQVSDIEPAAARIEQFEQILSKQRTELNKTVESIDKRAQHREADRSKIHQMDLEKINATLAELNTVFSPADLKKQFKERSLEEGRLNATLQDLRVKVEGTLDQAKEIAAAHKLLEESRRTDAKRVMDIQGELSAIRKRADEAREKVLIHHDSLRNLENRIGELMGTESARKDSQAAFVDQQNLAQVERERAWKDWQIKYDAFNKQAETMEAQSTTLEETLRAAKRAQDTYTELNQKLERRINEVTEMQRLAEERLRQEWVTFKADEQKRWTGHSLSQEESVRDLRKDMDKLEGRMNQLDDSAQTLQDQLHQTTETTEQQLQELMNGAHEWLTAYERIMGHGKSKTRKPARQ